MLKKKKIKLYKREKINLYLKNSIISDKYLYKIFKINVDVDSNSNFFIPTHYSDQLKEKRKIKIIYGVTEKKYKIYYNISKKKKGDIFKNILNIFESRLDNIVYRTGLATTRAEARQLILHNFINVNNKINNHPSKIIKVGDYINYNIKKKNFFRYNYFCLYYEKKFFPN